jgi:signal transduction histidine kinase
MIPKMNSDEHPLETVTNVPDNTALTNEPLVNSVLSRLKEIATGVMHAAEAQTLELVLEGIAEVARELVKAKYAALGIPDGHGGLRYFKVAGITPEAISLIDHLPHGHGLLGAVMAERQTLWVEHIASDPRAYGFPQNHPTMERFLGAPIQVGEQLFGMLYLTDRIDGHLFTDQDQWLVETLAGYAALAIAGSQLREGHSRLVLLEERERISMELHDGVIQSLYAIGMHLELLRTAKDPVEDGLKVAIHDLNSVIDDIRGYIMNLKRNDNQHTLRDSLHDLVRRLHIPASLRVEIEAPESKTPFSAARFDSLCQIINEAMSNVVRHAEAKEVKITAVQNGTHLVVTVKDNGKGFDPAILDYHDGLGLRNIYQRVRIHGGQVMVDSAPDAGTRVTVSIPLRQD